MSGSVKYEGVVAENECSRRGTGHAHPACFGILVAVYRWHDAYPHHRQHPDAGCLWLGLPQIYSQADTITITAISAMVVRFGSRLEA